jgi:hypothetical protein
MKILDTVLLLALPASGKSEVRRYLASLSKEQCEKEMHIGETLQLDDYPYVHFMHRIDDELMKRGFDPIFYFGPNRTFKDSFEWGTLIHLLNEDYHNLVTGTIVEVDDPANWLFDRIDLARSKVDLPFELWEIPYGIRMEIADAMYDECLAHLNELNETTKRGKEGKTIVIELSRGGANGSVFPLTPPRGYSYAFDQFSEEILDNAGILYVEVTPEESRRKNYERAKPDGQSSILNHGVPLEVMLGEYGCDDMKYLMNISDKENTVKIERFVEVKKEDKLVYDTKIWNIPVAVFDNKEDLTTFVREEPENWKKEDVDLIYLGLKNAFETLFNLMK